MSSEILILIYIRAQLGMIHLRDVFTPLHHKCNLDGDGQSQNGSDGTEDGRAGGTAGGVKGWAGRGRRAGAAAAAAAAGRGRAGAGRGAASGAAGSRAGTGAGARARARGGGGSSQWSRVLNSGGEATAGSVGRAGRGSTVARAGGRAGGGRSRLAAGGARASGRRARGRRARGRASGRGRAGSSTRAGAGAGLAGQIEQRVGVGEAVGQTEAGASALVRENVPPGVGVAEQRAGNLVPVGLGVGNGRDSLAHVRASKRPTTLGHPDLAAAGDGHSLLPGIIEEILRVVDAVGMHELVVRVLINTEPVELLNNIRVGAVGPGIPGVDVTDQGAAEGGAGDGRANLLDVVDEDSRLFTDTGVVLGASDRVAVEILATHGDTSHLLAEGAAVLVDGVLQGSNLVVHVAAGSPETQQKTGVFGDGGGNGLDGAVGGASLNHCVETGTGKGTVGADEVLGGLKCGLEVRLVHATSITLSRAIVEALVDGLGGRDRKGESEKLLRKHCVSGNECVC